MSGDQNTSLSEEVERSMTRESSQHKHEDLNEDSEGLEQKYEEDNEDFESDDEELTPSMLVSSHPHSTSIYCVLMHIMLRN
jgi:hypothetical protein